MTMYICGWLPQGSRRTDTVCQWIETFICGKTSTAPLFCSMPVNGVNKKVRGKLSPHKHCYEDICFCMYLLHLIPQLVPRHHTPRGHGSWACCHMISEHGEQQISRLRGLQGWLLSCKAKDLSSRSLMTGERKDTWVTHSSSSGRRWDFWTAPNVMSY